MYLIQLLGSLTTLCCVVYYSFSVKVKLQLAKELFLKTSHLKDRGLSALGLQVCLLRELALH